MSIVFLNEGYKPIEQAMIPVTDRGFLLADGIYEAIPANHHKPFRVDEHIKRLRNSLRAITRDLIIGICKKHKIPPHEKKISESELRDADEIWITSSGREIYPITQLDNIPVGAAQVGPMWEQLHELYQDFKDSLLEADSI